MKSTNDNIVRFDVELAPEDSKRLNEICKQSHRSRKNFAEALMMMALRSKNNTIDLNRLGVLIEDKK